MSISTHFTTFPDLGTTLFRIFRRFYIYFYFSNFLRKTEISLSDSKYDLNDPQNDSGDLIYGQNDIQTNALLTDQLTDGPTEWQSHCLRLKTRCGGMKQEY